MYRVLGIFLSVLILGCSKKNNDYFIGQITYDYSYSSEILNADSLASLKPNQGVFRYDLKNYQSQFIGADNNTYYYLSDLNKAVWYDKENGRYDCEDYSIRNDSILSFKLYDNNEKVLGYDVKVLEFQSKIFWTKYYVSEDLRISPATYVKHLAYNMNFYGEKVNGGLILKIEHRFKNYVMTGIVTDISNGTTEFKALELDEKVILESCNSYK